jgi:ubiquinone/menaquinone biosynthesis C-methylase UbiE
VLDIGTGTGQYLAPLRERVPQGRIIGGDLAPGMLRDLAVSGVPGGAYLLNADAEGLPLAGASCDAIIASYVLPLVPDIPRALAEMSRVLRPGGALLAVTMASVYMEELCVAINATLNKMGISRETRWGKVSKRFNLENGLAYLEPYFARVTVHQHESAFVFPEVEPVLAYVTSSRDVIRDDLPPRRTWDEFMAALREVVETDISARGEFRVSKAAGVLVAAK